MIDYLILKTINVDEIPLVKCLLFFFSILSAQKNVSRIMIFKILHQTRWTYQKRGTNNYSNIFYILLFNLILRIRRKYTVNRIIEVEYLSI